MLVRDPHLFLDTASARLGQAESIPYIHQTKLHQLHTPIQTQAKAPIIKRNKLKTQRRRQSSELQ